MVERLPGRPGECLERIGDSFPLSSAHLAKNSGNGSAPVPRDLVDEGLSLLGEGQGDMAAIARKVTSIKKSGLQ